MSNDETKKTKKPNIAMIRAHLNSRVLFFVVVMCSFVFVLGVTLAYMFDESETVTNTFVAGEVSCEVSETYKDNVKSNITVENTGNVPAYIRICLVSYWVDGNGNTVGKSSELPSELETSVDTAQWYKSESESGTGYATYYYATKGIDGSYALTSVAADVSTTDLLGGKTITLEVDSTSYTDADGNVKKVYQVVDVFAEAIQSEPDDAVKAAWTLP